MYGIFMTSPIEFQKDATKKCVFCQPSLELILKQTEHFTLMLDPFALVPGHLLLTSREHYGCLGELPEELQEEAIRLRNDACEQLYQAFKEPITRYEHGRAGHCLLRDSSTRSCHHYHEHLIPKHIPLHAQLSVHFKYLTYQSNADLCALYERYNEYLLVVEPGMENRFYIAKDKLVEPHLLRTLSAKAIGFPERANWENYTSCTLMLEGKQILQ